MALSNVPLLSNSLNKYLARIMYLLVTICRYIACSNMYSIANITTDDLDNQLGFIFIWDHYLYSYRTIKSEVLYENKVHLIGTRVNNQTFYIKSSARWYRQLLIDRKILHRAFTCLILALLFIVFTTHVLSQIWYQLLSMYSSC